MLEMKYEEKFLHVEGLTKIFRVGGILLGVRFAAVNNVSFDVGPQEVFCLVGESGSGKTTLGRMILGLIEPTLGKIFYRGKRVDMLRGRAERKWFLREVQPVFQNPFETFNPLKKVETYLFRTAITFNDSSSQVVRGLIERALSLVGLSFEEVAGKYPFEFSGGQLQRISIARALISNPRLLVADEPVSMVDASLRMSIVNLLRGLKEEHGISVVYITHDLATAYYIGDRAGVMYRGDIVEMGSVEDLFMDPLHPYTKLLLDSVPDLELDEESKKEVRLPSLEIKEFTGLGCKFYDRCGDPLSFCREKEPSAVVIDGRIVKCHKFSTYGKKFDR